MILGYPKILSLSKKNLKSIHRARSASKFRKTGANVQEIQHPRTQKKWILFKIGGHLHIPANQPISGTICPQTDIIWTSRAVFCGVGLGWAVVLRLWVDIGNGWPTQSMPNRVRHSRSGRHTPLGSQKRKALVDFSL